MPLSELGEVDSLLYESPGNFRTDDVLCNYGRSAIGRPVYFFPFSIENKSFNCGPVIRYCGRSVRRRLRSFVPAVPGNGMLD